MFTNYIYICKKNSSFIVNPKREKSKYLKMNKSSKGFVFFKEILLKIFISFLNTSMFPVVAFTREHMWDKAI